MNIQDAITSAGVIPVVVIDDASQAVPLATALAKGGLSVIEVTLRTQAGLDSIKEMRSVEGVIVGAGTVISEQQFDEAVAAEAQFVVSPGINRKTIDHALLNSIPIYPGIATATEIMMALDAGLTTVKFFPAECSGGAAAIKALSAPFGQVRFMPTGGINFEKLPQYLAISSVIAVGGSWMVPKDLLTSNNYSEITRLSIQASECVKSLRKS